jgi:hypothetical protein
MASKVIVINQRNFPWTAPHGQEVPSGGTAEVTLTPEVEYDLEQGVITLKKEPAPPVTEAPVEAPAKKIRAPLPAHTESQEPS